MPYLIVVDRPMYWAVGNPVVAAGLTEVSGATVTGLTLISDANENTFLGAAAGSAGDYTPLPDRGEWLEAGEIYGYNNGLVIVRQSHSRTEHAPEDVPALFSVYREDAADALAWIANEPVLVGTRRLYEGVLYECIQAHTTQEDWTPPAVPALWMAVIEPGGTEWTPGVTYAVDDEVTYQDKTYRCLQAHTAYPDWTPIATLNVLWAELAVGPTCPQWVQPTGAHDAYNIGDCVTFNGNLYESKINANVWSPAVYPAGWEYQGPAE